VTRLVILGAGGHGRVIADVAERLGAFARIVFLDDRFPVLTQTGPWPVIGRIDSEEWPTSSEDKYIVAVGDATLRLILLEGLKRDGLPLVSVVHPFSSVSSHVKIGGGSVVLAGACINFGAVLGEGVIVNTGATVDHDCVLSDGVHICPGAHIAGEVVIGPRTWIGIGSAIKQCLNIGKDVTTGAGAVVIADVPDAVTVIGIPARIKV
jgi:sugar O-acyltransferase (sialic acid O-acetyltransferase NeuD family)